MLEIGLWPAMEVYILIDTEDWPRNNFIETSSQVAGGHKRTTISENIVTVEARKCGGLKKMNSPTERT